MKTYTFHLLHQVLLPTFKKLMLYHQNSYASYRTNYFDVLSILYTILLTIMKISMYFLTIC